MKIIQKNKERIKSIDKALDLLEFLYDKKQETGIVEISQNVNMVPSTVHRILTTLKSRGYVFQNQKTLGYLLGIKLFIFGCELQSNKLFINTINPYLAKLSKYTSETANLAILDGKDVLYLAKYETQEVLSTNIKIGTKIPAHCTALGKVLLAFHPANDFKQLYENDKPMVTLTPQSISSLEELKKELKKVRAQGYALDIEEYSIGINCISVPVFIQNGELLAAISITGPASRFTMDKMEDAKEKLRIISKEITSSFHGT